MKILTIILKMSLTGSLIYLSFLALRPISRKYFSSAWHYGMLVLILGFFILPADGLMDLARGDQSPGMTWEIQEGEDFLPAGQREEAVPSKPGPREEPSPAPLEENINREARSRTGDLGIARLRSFGTYIWLLGLVVFLLRRIIPYLGLKSYILREARPVEDPALLALFRETSQELGLGKNPDLSFCPGLASPMLMGLVRPRILLPLRELEARSWKMVFLHELNHYRRKDILLKGLAVVINGLHWFNPLVYLVLGELDKYCEYSIDERVVRDMDLGQRKQYGETILGLINSSIQERSYLTTSMGKGGSQLKARLEKMIYSFKTSRKRRGLSLLLGLIILGLGLLVASRFLPATSLEEEDSLVVFIQEEGLYYSDLTGGRAIKIQEGQGFQYPLISGEGSYIAYSKDDSLYVYSRREKTYEKISHGIEPNDRPYVWLGDKLLAYSPLENPGLRVLNLESQEEIQGQDQAYYRGLLASGDASLYANSLAGLVRIDLARDPSRGQNLWAEPILDLDASPDYQAWPWGISADGGYLYIMEKPVSASLASDQVGLGLYDINRGSYRRLEAITSLGYQDNLAISPTRNSLGIIQGAGRDMLDNKDLALVDLDGTGSITSLLDKDYLAMTPSFSQDGKKLFYTAREPLDLQEDFDYNQVYENWASQPYKIYEYDLENQKTRSLTQGQALDFMPLDLAGEGIIFLRARGQGYYSLVRLDGKRERLIQDRLIFTGGKAREDFGFYGHIDREKGLDIYLARKEKKSPAQAKSPKRPEDLYELRASYLGDNSRVDHILSSLDFPEGLEPAGMELFTKTEKLGLRVNFQADDQGAARHLSRSEDYLWRGQSLALFSLIDNLDYVEYSLKNRDQASTLAYMTRASADSLLEDSLGFKTGEVARNKKNFREFYAAYLEEDIQEDPSRGLVGHIKIEGDRLDFRPAEILEWQDQASLAGRDLEEEDFPNGYLIIGGEGQKSFQLDQSTIYSFTDHKLNFGGEENPRRLYQTRTREEFIQHLDQYGVNDLPLDQQKLVYFIEVEGDRVISITEKFRYTF